MIPGTASDFKGWQGGHRLPSVGQVNTVPFSFRGLAVFRAEGMTRGQKWFATEASENRMNRFSFVGGRARRYDGQYRHIFTVGGDPA